MSAPKCPLISVAVNSTSKVGVVMAAYSARYTRMWSWQVKALKLIGYQDIKANAEILDISDDGRYISYSACAFWRCNEYMAVSRPPYFHALYLTNMLHVMGHHIRFGENKKIHVYREKQRESAPWKKLIEEGITPGCPFKVVDHGFNFPDSVLNDPGQGKESPRIFRDWEAFPTKEDWIGKDSEGREVWIDGPALYIDGNRFIDLSRPRFEAVEPQEWAMRW